MIKGFIRLEAITIINTYTPKKETQNRQRKNPQKGETDNLMTTV